MPEVKLTNLDAVQAEKKAQELVRLEAVVAKLKEDIKVYVEQNGDFVAAGKIWSFSESTSVKFSTLQKAEVAKALAVEGVNFFDVAKFSATDLQKIGWTEEKMATYGTVSKSNRFSSKNEK
ncbi:hypothetical protein ACQKEY_22600 [Lysinibacillus fusiformis]|uniref:hypothetical protein n=1 Tax=Lysinibacillus fusiformis TaxID=28031 RepID=UPI002E1FF265|nr:hypothetical protein [Lysinibacillus fusiformis]